MVLSNEIRAKHDVSWQQLRASRALNANCSLEHYITCIAGQERPLSNGDRAVRDLEWRLWREAQPESRLSLEDFIRDYGKAQTQDTTFQVPKGYGPMATAPKEILMPLKGYQRRALHWLLQEPHIKILADDMGLGKTVTTLSYIFSLPNRGNGSRCALIVVPKPLLRNWYNEYEKTCDQELTNIILVHAQEGTHPYKEDVNGLRAWHIVLTTPGTLFAQITDYDRALQEISTTGSANVPANGWPLFGVPPPKTRSRDGKATDIGGPTSWQCFVFDEVHMIRNRNGHISKALPRIRAERRLAISGTIIQNTPEDVFSVLRLIQDPAGSDWPHFKAKVVTPIHERPKTEEEDFKGLHDIFERCLLRRDKSMIIEGKPILDLPKKIILQHHANFSALEERIYAAAYSAGMEELRRFESLRTNRLVKADFTNILECILRLRQICCDPLLLLDGAKAREAKKKKYQEDEEDEDLLEEDEVRSFSTKARSLQPELEAALQSEELRSRPPAKIMVLLAQLGYILEKEPNATIIIFAEWSRLLDRVQQHLKANGYKFELFDGRTSVEDRSELLETYHVRPNRGLLMTLGTGGQGLNLVAATHMFMLTPAWNPQKEYQAMDRIYRLGQKIDVTIHFILARSLGYAGKSNQPDENGTIEDFIMDKQRMKLAFVAGAFGLAHEGESRGYEGTGGASIEDAKTFFGNKQYGRHAAISGSDDGPVHLTGSGAMETDWIEDSDDEGGDGEADADMEE